MKKILNQFFVAVAAFGFAFIVFWGVTVVLGAWTEPSQTPPGGNVAAPINVGGDTQDKIGKITARDVWSRDSGGGEWMWDIVKLRDFRMDGTAANGEQLIGYFGDDNVSGAPASSGTWSVSSNQLHLPAGVALTEITGLLLRVKCNEVNLFIDKTIANISTVDTSADYVCSSGNNGADVNDTIVPVTANASGVSMGYRFILTDPHTFGLTVDVIGYYYH